jgi:tartrate dehydrogenase/decarboxylase/D-malate dehydrogenase
MTRAGVPQSRPRKLLTVVTKSNAQRHAMVMWDEIAAEVAAEFPDVTWDKMLVDAMTMRMVSGVCGFITIVATNLRRRRQDVKPGARVRIPPHQYPAVVV